MNNKILKEASKSSLENFNLLNVKQLPLWHDYVFKRVFSYEGNESVLKDFLEAVLNIKIDNIEIKNPEIIKTYQEGKKSILDIKVGINDGTIIDVEMQVENEGNLDERTTTYLGQLISEQLHAGEPYTKLKKAIIIFILNFNYTKRNSYHNIRKA